MQQIFSQGHMMWEEKWSNAMGEWLDTIRFSGNIIRRGSWTRTSPLNILLHFLAPMRMSHVACMGNLCGSLLCPEHHFIFLLSLGHHYIVWLRVLHLLALLRICFSLALHCTLLLLASHTTSISTFPSRTMSLLPFASWRTSLWPCGGYCFSLWPFGDFLFPRLLCGGYCFSFWLCGGSHPVFVFHLVACSRRSFHWFSSPSGLPYSIRVECPQKVPC